jgi:anti-sigma regulatory factor (Ser/Thr protein kinase)
MLELPSRAQAPAAARKALTALNGSLHLLSSVRLADVQLLVSELVTNAVRHANSPESLVGLSVLATEDVVRVEVSDGGRGFTPEPGATLREHDATAGGWGLPIVEAIAQRWGVEHGDGTTVWFEVDRPQSEAPDPIL